jgi:hypothetical protein
MAGAGPGDMKAATGMAAVTEGAISEFGTRGWQRKLPAFFLRENQFRVETTRASQPS